MLGQSAGRLYNPFANCTTKGYSISEQLSISKKFEEDKITYAKEPSEVDILETSKLLKDFGIKIDIPKFKSLAEMLRWRKSEIKDKLVNKKSANKQNKIEYDFTKNLEDKKMKQNEVRQRLLKFISENKVTYSHICKKIELLNSVMTQFKNDKIELWESHLDKLDKFLIDQKY